MRKIIQELSANTLKSSEIGLVRCCLYIPFSLFLYDAWHTIPTLPPYWILGGFNTRPWTSTIVGMMLIPNVCRYGSELKFAFRTCKRQQWQIFSKTRAGVCKTLCPQLPDSNTVWLQHCLAMTVTTVQIYDFNVILSKGNNSKIGDDWDKKKIRITYFFHEESKHEISKH